MKKIKWTIMTLVILAGISLAFAGRPRGFQTLFYYNGSQYVPVGLLGVSYICVASSQVCTYSYSNGIYVPYEINATYVPVELTADQGKSKVVEKEGE